MDWGTIHNCNFDSSNFWKQNYFEINNEILNQNSIWLKRFKICDFFLKLYLFGCSPLISRVSWICSHKSNFQKSLAVWAWLPSPSQQAYKTPELILFILEGRSKVVQKNTGREFPRQNYDGFKISLSSHCPCGICSFSASHAFPVLLWSEYDHASWL